MYSLDNMLSNTVGQMPDKTFSINSNEEWNNNESMTIKYEVMKCSFSCLPFAFYQHLYDFFSQIAYSWMHS